MDANVPLQITRQGDLCSITGRARMALRLQICHGKTCPRGRPIDRRRFRQFRRYLPAVVVRQQRPRPHFKAHHVPKLRRRLRSRGPLVSFPICCQASAVRSGGSFDNAYTFVKQAVWARVTVRGRAANERGSELVGITDQIPHILNGDEATVPASKSTLEKYSAAYTRYMAHRSSRPPIARNGQSETSDPTGTKLRLAMELAKDAMIRNNPGIPREDLMAQARQAAPNAAGSAAQRVEASASVARKGAPKAAKNTSTPSRPTGYMQQVLSGNTQGQQGTPPQMSQPGTSFLGGATKYFR